MRTEVDFSSGQHSSPGPGGLLVEVSASVERFGVIHFGKSADGKAAGIWGDALPLAVIPDKADDIGKGYADLRREPPNIEVGGQVGLLRQPHSGLFMPWSRKRRAVYAEFLGRKYAYYCHWWHRCVVREGVGEVARCGYGSYHLTDRADPVDASVGLLIAQVIDEEYITLFG